MIKVRPPHLYPLPNLWKARSQFAGIYNDQNGGVLDSWNTQIAWE